MIEGLGGCGSLVWVHLKQLREKINSTGVGPHKELVEISLQVVRERCHVVTGLEERERREGKQTDSGCVTFCNPRVI